MRVRRYAINPDTGGPGRWRGGCGLIREIEVLAPEAMVSMRIDSVEHPPWGVAGGHAARHRALRRQSRAGPTSACCSRSSDGNIVKRGDIVRIETGGGGGWGHPFDREPERVLADVRGGFVSRASAERDYGVVLTRRRPLGRCGRRRPSAAPIARRPSSSIATATTTALDVMAAACDQAASRARHERAIVGVDTGGTFTDVTLLDPATGRRRGPPRRRRRRDDPSRGFGNGIAEVLAERGARPARRRPRAARHDGRHQPDPRGQGRRRPR